VRAGFFAHRKDQDANFRKGPRLKRNRGLKANALAFAGAAVLSLASPVAGFLQDAARAEQAQVEPDRLAAAKDLMEVTGTPKQFDLLLPMIMSQVENAFIQLKPEHAQAIKESFKIAVSKFMERKQEAFEKVAVVYAERFTAAELREIIAFYKSPIGEKLIKAQPEIAQKTLAIGQAWGRKIGQEIEQEVRKELKNRGIAL
jgi:uncharacterized protein